MSISVLVDEVSPGEVPADLYVILECRKQLDKLQKHEASRVIQFLRDWNEKRAARAD